MEPGRNSLNPATTMYFSEFVSLPLWFLLFVRPYYAQTQLWDAV